MSGAGPAPAAGRTVRYVDVLAVREFRAVFVAQALSLLGDRAAAVALAVLVYDRSASPVLSASVFALTFLPHLFAAPLAAFVDRLPRRTVLVACDLARLPLVLAMLVPGLPVPLLLVLLGLVTLIEVPYDAARAVVTRAVLDDDQYPVGNALASALHQASLLAGSLAGGLLVAATSAQACLLVNAATFGVAAVLARAFLAPHPPLPDPARQPAGPGQDGLRQTLRHLCAPDARRVLLVSCLAAGVGTAPEGLAVAYAGELGGGAVLAGALAAAVPAGGLCGDLLLPRLLGRRAQQLMVVPLAALTLLALAVLLVQPPVAAALGLWVLVGVGTTVTVLAAPVLMAAVPDDHRARAYGLATSLLIAAQALAVVAAAGLAHWLSVSRALGVLGAVALVALVVLAGLAGLRRPAAPAPAGAVLVTVTGPAPATSLMPAA